MEKPGPNHDPYYLDIDEIVRCETIREDVVREALAQATILHDDLTDTRKGYEAKALGLFGGFVTGSLGLFAAAGAAIAGDLAMSSTPLAVAGGVLALGAVCFVLSLWDLWYGHTGSSPDMWLRRGTLDGQDGVLVRTLAYLVHHYRKRIEISLTANKRKKWWIRAGILLGAIAPFAFGATLLAIGPDLPPDFRTKSCLRDGLLGRGSDAQGAFYG